MRLDEQSSNRVKYRKVSELVSIASRLPRLRAGLPLCLVSAGVALGGLSKKKVEETRSLFIGLLSAVDDVLDVFLHFLCLAFVLVLEKRFQDAWSLFLAVSRLGTCATAVAAASICFALLGRCKDAVLAVHKLGSYPEEQSSIDWVLKLALTSKIARAHCQHRDDEAPFYNGNGSPYKGCGGTVDGD